MQLDPKDWRRISELLDNALDMSEREQSAWLDELSKQGMPLIEPLRKLLAQRARFETNDVLATPPDFKAALAAENSEKRIATELQVGALIGAYKLDRELGRGGMGAVWLAQRVDGKFKRDVALKFPYAGPAERQLIERLGREREILATLEHPYIARLYDADVTPTGQPFLVLEYVVGEPIDAYCDGHALTLERRIELFLKVLGAVQYAHTRLVIHRDLKPSNILVDADGAPRLLDFGIAKLVSDRGETETALTLFGGRALTPDYASPEQILGGAVTTASDVYALGVILFELLTQARPYMLKRDSRAALEEAIAQAEVTPPSRAAPPLRARELRGDLDTILLKALGRYPAERYATADAFALDLRRYLENKPIEARPDSLWYRAQKFTRRNKLAVGASAVIALSLLVGASAAIWQYSIAKQNELKAIAEAKTAEAVKQFMIEIFQTNTLAQADPAKARQKTALEILEAGAERIDVEFKDNPVAKRELMTVIVRMLGESRSPTYEKWAEKLAALWQNAPGGEIKAAELNRELAMLAARRSLDEAEKLAQRSIERLGTPLTAEARKARAGLLETLGNTLSAKSKYAEAKPVLHEAQSLLREEFSNTTDYGYTLRDLGVIELQLGNNDGALDYLSRAQLAFEADRTTLPRTFGLIYHDLGSAYFNRKEYAAAERQYRLSWESMTKAYGPTDQQSARQAVDVAGALIAQRRFDDALEVLRPALDSLTAASPNFHSRYLRIGQHTLMTALVASGRLSEAQRLLPSLLDGIEQEVPILAARIYDVAAEYASVRGLAKDTLEYQRKLDATVNAVIGPDSPRARGYRLENARRLIDLDLIAEARRILDSVTSIANSTAELNDGVSLQASRLQIAANIPVDARNALSGVLERYLARSPDRRDLGEEIGIRFALGLAQMKNGDPASALPNLERVLELRRVEWSMSPYMAEAQSTLAACLFKLGKTDRARELDLSARRILGGNNELSDRFRTPVRRRPITD